MSKPAPSTGEAFHRKHRSFFVGLFVIVPAILIPSLLVYTVGKAELFQDWRHLHVIYESSYGLSKGDVVTVSDIQVGQVTSVDLTPDGRAYVSLKILTRHAHLVRKNSVASLRQKNILFGDWLIALSKGNLDRPPVEESDTLKAEPPMRLDKVIDQIRTMVATFERILLDVDAGKGFVGHLMKDDTLVTLVADVVSEFGRTARIANRALRNMDAAFKDFGELSRTSSEVPAALLASLDSIGPAITDARVLLQNLNQTTGYLPPVLEQAQTDLEEIEVLLKGLQKHWLFRRSVRKGQEDDEDEEEIPDSGTESQ